MSKILSDNALVLISKVYTSSIGILLLPYLLQVLGKEQFGLIGSFVVVQACMQILDAGISGVLTRQSILTQKNRQSFSEFTKVLKYFLLLFFLIALTIATLGHIFGTQYGPKWFNSSLDKNIIGTSVSLMFIIFSIRYVQGPIKSILISYEKHKQLALFDMLYATFNNPIALLYIYVIGGDIRDFFKIQFLVSLIFMFLIAAYAWSSTNRILNNLRPAEDGRDIVHTHIRDLIKFGVQLSFLSMLWVLVSQSDKLTLTRYMDLSEYSFYAISVSLLGVVSIFVGTMIQTVRPRLTAHLSKGEFPSFTYLFKYSVISLISLLLPLILFLSVYGEELLYLWTQNNELAVKVMRYFPYLMIATFFASISEFSFMLLYSTGNLKAHTIFYSVVSAFIIPINIYIASEYLGEGSSRLFMFFNFFLFATWSLYNIRRYLTETGRLFSVSILLSGSIATGLIFISTLVIDELTLKSLIILLILGGLSVLISYLSLIRYARFLNVEFKGGCK